MVDNSETISLEMEKLRLEKENLNHEKDKLQLEQKKIDLERDKAIWDCWVKIVTVIVTVMAGTVMVGWINNVYQDRQFNQQQLLKETELQLQQKKNEAELKLQQKKAEADRQQSEMKYLGDFITYALEDDYNKRIRFAEYFATLTISSDLRSKWENYHLAIKKIIDEEQQIKEELSKAKQSGNNEKVKELQKKQEQIQPKLAALPRHLAEEQYRRKFELDANWRPMKYIDNKYKVKKKIVVDHATKLMWQQSGSSQLLTYDDAQLYIKQMNHQKFAGYDDWRLPMVSELISLLEPKKQDNGLYIKPIFDEKQNSCWSSDRRTSGSAWQVYFHYGDVYWAYFDNKGYVRVVRSWP